MCACVCDTGVLVIRLGDVVVMVRVGDGNLPSFFIT